MSHCICIALNQQSSTRGSVRITHYCDSEHSLIKELSSRLWESRLSLRHHHDLAHVPKPRAKDPLALLSQYPNKNQEPKERSSRKLSCIPEGEEHSGVSKNLVMIVQATARYERMTRGKPRIVDIKYHSDSIAEKKSWSSLDILPTKDFTMTKAEDDPHNPDESAVSLHTTSSAESRQRTWRRRLLRPIRALLCRKQKYLRLGD